MKLPLTKVTLNLREGDFDFLQSVYHAAGVGASTVVRALVQKHVDELRAKEETPNPEVKFNV